MGWDEPRSLVNSSDFLWRCWAVCDGCGQLRWTECTDLVASGYPEFVEKIEAATLAELHAASPPCR